MVKRSDKIADEIKRWIVEQELDPGHRLPQEKELIDRFRSSKGTVREAIKGLEAQGLVTTRTGPGGGVFVAEVADEKAMSMLSNFFYFKDLGIKDIYQLRIKLEPEIAESLCGQLTEADLERLKATITIYSSPAATLEEEYQQRLDEFAFHEVLAELCTNSILSFICLFLIKLLKNLELCHQIYNQPNQELYETGRYYQLALYDALKNNDKVRARTLMEEHMRAAEAIMSAKEMEIKGMLL